MTRIRGFTLLELLVAMAVLAVMAALAYGGLNSVVDQYDDGEAEVAALAARQRALSLLQRDLLQAQPRPAREPYHGDRVGALVADPDAEFPFELTRGGWSNPAQRRRATLHRVAWRVDDDGVLERLHWQTVDRGSNEPPVATPVLDGVAELRWRFLDAQDAWHEVWPPAAATVGPATLPRGVEVTIVFEDGEEIVRVHALVD